MDGQTKSHRRFKYGAIPAVMGQMMQTQRIQCFLEKMRNEETLCSCCGMGQQRSAMTGTGGYYE